MKILVMTTTALFLGFIGQASAQVSSEGAAATSAGATKDMLDKTTPQVRMDTGEGPRAVSPQKGPSQIYESGGQDSGQTQDPAMRSR